MDFKKYGAVGILAVMMLGVISAAGQTLIENTKKLATLKEREQNLSSMVREIKRDVKEIKDILIRRRP